MDVPGADSSKLPDPVIEWYKRSVDRSLIRENLLKTHEERLLSLQGCRPSSKKSALPGRPCAGAIHSRRPRNSKASVRNADSPIKAPLSALESLP